MFQVGHPVGVTERFKANLTFIYRHQVLKWAPGTEFPLGGVTALQKLFVPENRRFVGDCAASGSVGTGNGRILLHGAFHSHQRSSKSDSRRTGRLILADPVSRTG
jgi:hypothetical protein